MDTKNYTVLVIEDEQLLLEAIARKLKFNGLSVIPVARGDEALKILSESEKLPDVIKSQKKEDRDPHICGKQTAISNNIGRK